MPYSQSYYR
jgi:hypothetical protein